MNYLKELLNNMVLWVAILSWAVAQIIKVIIELYRTKKINVSLFIGSGGMPSSHSSFVTSMTTGIGFKEGFDSTMFAISAIISLIVMYDAAGVRRAAGKQAAVLNVMMKNYDFQGLKIDARLKELLGHSPVEVAAGAILGILISIIFSFVIK